MIKKILIYQLRIPFQFQISHNLARRDTGESILVVVEDDKGVIGCGEGTPREYVTGETVLRSFASAESLALKISQVNAGSASGLLSSLDKLGQSASAKSSPAAWCAIETACLDLYAKRNNLPFWRLFTEQAGNRDFEYSAVIPLLPLATQDVIFDLVGKNKIQFVKLKVDNVASGIEQVKYARNKLGSEVNLRIDANGAFSKSESIKFLEQVKKFSISAIEQPVAKDNLEAFKEIKANSDGILIFADESLNTMADAAKLLNADACHGLNIRLSKCGGIINCLKLCRFARLNDFRYQIGCHVGESSILSAVGRHLASVCTEYLFLEGSFSKYMLVDDISNEEISFGYRGHAEMLAGPGHGVSINQERLNRWAELQHTVFP